MNDDPTPGGESRGTAPSTAGEGRGIGRSTAGESRAPAPSSPVDSGIGEDAQASPAGYVRASERRQRAVLAFLACGALGVVIWLIWPVGVGIFLGVLLAFTVEPLYRRLVQSHMRPALTALITVFLSALALAAAVGGFTLLFVNGATEIGRELRDWLGSNSPFSLLGSGTVGLLRRVGLAPENLEARLHDAGGAIAARLGQFAEVLLSTTAAALLGLLFAMLSMYFILRHGPKLARQAELVSPLHPSYTRALIEEFRRVGRTTLLGTIVTGISQGVFAFIGYLVTGVAHPAFWGAVTAVASLVPGVGTMIVWTPAGIFLILSGHVPRGVLELVWGAAIVVGLADYVIRPRLVGGGEGEMPTVVTFAALFGGVELFGLKGLIVGPILMSLALSVLRIYAEDAKREKLAGPG